MKLLITAFLLIFGNAFLANAQTNAYPREISDKIQEANTKIVCETEKPRRVGIVFYKNKKEDWLILVFTQNSEMLEIWHYKNRLLIIGYVIPSKIYYKTEQGWIDKDQISSAEADKLDNRLKFTNEEKEYFKKCVEEKAKELGVSL